MNLSRAGSGRRPGALARQSARQSQSRRARHGAKEEWDMSTGALIAIIVGVSVAFLLLLLGAKKKK
jgi:hypothetical protein